MRRLALGLMAALVVSGCSGGDGGGSSHCKDDGSGDNFVLTTGTYDLHDIDVVTDGCQLTDGISFASVSVSGSTVSMGVLDLARTGNSLEGSGSTTNDQSPFDCVLRTSVTGSGVVTGNDAFRITEEEIVITVESGTECTDAVEVLIPCSTKLSFCAEKP